MPSRAAPGVDNAAARPMGADTVSHGKPSADLGRHPVADGGLWRGPTEGHWIARLLKGVPAPRDPTPPRFGRTPPD